MIKRMQREQNEHIQGVDKKTDAPQRYVNIKQLIRKTTTLYFLRYNSSSPCDAFMQFPGPHAVGSWIWGKIDEYSDKVFRDVLTLLLFINSCSKHPQNQNAVVVDFKM